MSQFGSFSEARLLVLDGANDAERKGNLSEFIYLLKVAILLAEADLEAMKAFEDNHIPTVDPKDVEFIV